MDAAQVQTATVSNFVNGVGRFPRVPFGVRGLDDILYGGLPAGHLYLLEGTPGAGKTTLALQFALTACHAGQRALYITLSESRKELLAVAASHGWRLDPVPIFELTP